MHCGYAEVIVSPELSQKKMLERLTAAPPLAAAIAGGKKKKKREKWLGVHSATDHCHFSIFFLSTSWCVGTAQEKERQRGRQMDRQRCRDVGWRETATRRRGDEPRQEGKKHQKIREPMDTESHAAQENAEQGTE